MIALPASGSKTLFLHAYGSGRSFKASLPQSSSASGESGGLYGLHRQCKAINLGRAGKKSTGRLNAAAAPAAEAGSQDGNKPAVRPLVDFPALPAVLLLLGNAVLTRDALLLASFFGIQVALPIPKLRKMGMSAYNALAASASIVFLTWAAVARALPAGHLQAVDIQSSLTIPLPKMLVHWSSTLAARSHVLVASRPLLRSPIALPAILLAVFLSANIVVLRALKKRRRKTYSAPKPLQITAVQGGKPDSLQTFGTSDSVSQNASLPAAEFLDKGDFEGITDKAAKEDKAKPGTQVTDVAIISVSPSGLNKTLPGRPKRANSSTASTGQAYKRPSYMTEQANFGPVKSPASTVSGDPALGQPEPYIVQNRAETSEAPAEAGRPSLAGIKDEKAGSSSGKGTGSTISVALINGQATGSVDSDELEKTINESGDGSSQKIEALQPPFKGDSATQKGEDLATKYEAVLERLAELEKRPTSESIISAEEFKALSEQVQAHSLIDMHAKWTQLSHQTNDIEANFHEKFLQQAAELGRVKISVASLREGLEAAQSSVDLLQNDSLSKEEQSDSDVNGREWLLQYVDEQTDALEARTEDLSDRVSDLEADSHGLNLELLKQSLNPSTSALEQETEQVSGLSSNPAEQGDNLESAQEETVTFTDALGQQLATLKDELASIRREHNVEKTRIDIKGIQDELEKSQTRVTCIQEDMVRHMHSPQFAKRITAECIKATAALEEDVRGIKAKLGMLVKAQPEASGLRVEAQRDTTESFTGTQQAAIESDEAEQIAVQLPVDAEQETLESPSVSQLETPAAVPGEWDEEGTSIASESAPISSTEASTENLEDGFEVAVEEISEEV